MRHFTTTELERMQNTQESAMMDTCVIYAYQSGAQNTYGMPAETYLAGDPTICGLDDKARKEVMDDTQVAVTDAVLRLPVDTVLDHRDLIEVTHRFGTAITSVVYEQIGEARGGPSGLLVNLRLETEGKLDA